jgi:enoyl-CoA hydratase/carnithine racemase
LHDGTLTVQLDRPAKKNAISLAMWRGLESLARSASTDPAVRVVVITGGPSCFSAGADIGEFAIVRSTPEQVAVYEASVDGALAAVAQSLKPTVAAISGVCFAGGLALAASADFRVANATASFSVSAVRMGLVYNIAKCKRLYQIVGLSAAKRILMTGERFGSADAKELGVVDRVVEDDAYQEALTLAAALASGAPLAMTGMKAILDALAAGTVEIERAGLEQHIAAADTSEDHREAVRAFAEKRRPVFRGI